MWLDSAKQMPPDISTPPLLRKSAVGYDLVVNDNPKIGREPIYKPTYDFKGAYTANGAFRGQRISTQSLDDGTLVYAADGLAPYEQEQPTWKPSIHMPRWASRILLEITAVRVERLQAGERSRANPRVRVSPVPETVA